jgi:hypothetical protein
LRDRDIFAWWKQHLKVYHLISRSRHGLMIQMITGLITYLLLAIYCREEFNEPVSIQRVRQLRTQILNESRMAQTDAHAMPRKSNLESVLASP